MLTGPELGAAIDAARLAKNLSKKALSEHFRVAPPSVQGWIKTGRIDKSKLIEVINFFSDVVGPEHWGLTKRSGKFLLAPNYPAILSNALAMHGSDDEAFQDLYGCTLAEARSWNANGIPDDDRARKCISQMPLPGVDFRPELLGAEKKHVSDAADKLLNMLKKKQVLHGLNPEIVERINAAVAESLSEPHPNVIPANFSRAPKLMDGDILIPQYDLRASMGHGQVPADYVEFMRNVVISGVQLEKLGLDYTSPANLSIITGWGESMSPTIKSKDPVIVDRGVTDFIGDGVYVITWDGMLYIKRLQSAGDAKLELISDNPKHKDRVVNTDEVTVHARVLLVWNAQKL